MSIPALLPSISPLERYRASLAQPGFEHDPAQEQAVRHLQRLYDELVVTQPQSTGLLGRLSRPFRKPPTPIKGLYFWGGVGRGKTYLMDLLFDAVPIAEKARMHFHRFMREVHAQLQARQGESDPLRGVAQAWSSRIRLLCFDEFFVSDITDAMLLGTLLEHLFNQGVILVTTSNIHPDGLYPNGLQRSRFLPAIALLKAHTEVVNVDGGIDHRLRTLTRAPLYYSPLGQAADDNLMACFQRLGSTTIEADAVMTIDNRPIQTRYLVDDLAWFDFDQLCDGPRSQRDYIELAELFETVVISNIPLLTTHHEDQSRRFINLVDEFYDCSVKLILSAAAPLAELYQGERLRFEFERTRSRLLEMQSHDYLARAHRRTTGGP